MNNFIICDDLSGAKWVEICGKTYIDKLYVEEYLASLEKAV